MDRFLSAQNADRLLGDATRSVADLPPEAAPLAAFLATLRAPAEIADAARYEPAIAGLAAAIRANRPVPIAQRSRPNRFRRTSVKAASAAFAALLASGTAVAAAATGSLPAPIQRAVSDALAHVDVSVPHPGSGASFDPHARGNATPGSTHTPPVSTHVRDAAGNDLYGACASATHGPAGSATHPASSSAAIANLERAAAAAGQTVAEFCRTVTPGDKGPGTTSHVPGGHAAGGSGAAGPPAHTPGSSPGGSSHPGNGSGNGNGDGGSTQGNGHGNAKGSGHGSANGDGGAHTGNTNAGGNVSDTAGGSGAAGNNGKSNAPGNGSGGAAGTPNSTPHARS